MCLRLLRHLRRHNTCHITRGSLTPLITYDIISHGLITPHEPLTFFCVPRFIITGHLSLIWDHHPFGPLNTSKYSQISADIVWTLVTIMAVVTICLTCWLIFVAETTQEEPGQVNNSYLHLHSCFIVKLGRCSAHNSFRFPPLSSIVPLWTLLISNDVNLFVTLYDHLTLPFSREETTPGCCTLTSPGSAPSPAGLSRWTQAGATRAVAWQSTSPGTDFWWKKNLSSNWWCVMCQLHGNPLRHSPGLQQAVCWGRASAGLAWGTGRHQEQGGLSQVCHMMSQLLSQGEMSPGQGPAPYTWWLRTVCI